ncbi:uncharacterized protein LOC111682915, partial [Lucilia cuprina]|uniref:uncharacterized protein LOC111682915 n=1 Tax=Lucilia cuprina TaxID=7375 RepID=UPI001F05D623
MKCSTLEILYEEYDSSHNVNKSQRRRSRRTRTKNVRYISDEDNPRTVSPESISHNGKNTDNDYIIQEPSSSTSRRGTGFKNLNDIKRNNIMDNILMEIGLYDELHDFMTANGITGEALKYMQIRHIDELFKDTNCLGTKIIFEHRLKEWQNKNASCEVSTTQTMAGGDKVNNRIETKSFQSTLNGMLPETEINNLSTLLTNAVQQTINTVLQDFKKSSQKQILNKTNKTPMGINREVLNPRITLKKIKIEPVEETILPDNPPKSMMKTSNKLIRVSDDVLLSNQSVDITISPQPKRRKVDFDINVKEILTSTPAVENILHEYARTELLTPEQSDAIVRSIVEFYVRNKLILTISRCKEIAQEILQLFPTECLVS